MAHLDSRIRPFLKSQPIAMYLLRLVVLGGVCGQHVQRAQWAFYSEKLGTGEYDGNSQYFCLKRPYHPPQPYAPTGGSPPGGRATGAPGQKTGRKAQRHRGALCGAGRTRGAPCGDIHQGGGRENSARHKDFRGGSGPTSYLLAMKRHGPFSSPGHVRDHEPFFIHWDRAIPLPGYPQP